MVLLKASSSWMVKEVQKLKEMQDNLSRDAVLIVLTANAMAGVKERYLEKGFDDYVAKPVDGLALEKVLMQKLPEAVVHKIETEE